MKITRASGGRPTISCKRTATRKLTIELDGMELKSAFFTLMLAGEKPTKAKIAPIQKIWESLWVLYKQCPSYTARINGRLVVDRQRVVSKTLRTSIANWKKANANSSSGS